MKTILAPLFAAALPAAAAGCALGEDSIRLATITSAGPGEIVLGEENRILGEGFIPGPVEVILEGLWKAGGEHAFRGRSVIEGRASGENEVSFAAGRDALPGACAPHVFFEGRVTVRMRTPKGKTTRAVDAVRERVRFDFLDVEPSGAAACRGGGGAGGLDAFLRDAGVSVEERVDEGAVVTAVHPGGAAARAGIAAGDVIVVAEGMRVLAGEDLVPPPGSASMRLAVFRPGAGGLIPVTLQMGRRVERGVEWKNVALLLLLCGVVLLAHTRTAGRLLSWKRRPKEGAGATAPPPAPQPAAETPEPDGTAALFGIEPTAPGRGAPLPPAIPANVNVVVDVDVDDPRPQKPLERVTALLVSLVVVLPAVSISSVVLLRDQGRIPSWAPVAGLFVLSFLASVGSPRPGGNPLLGTARRLALSGLLVVPLLLVYALRWLRTSYPTLLAAGSEQAFSPWTWNGLKEPFSLVLLLCALLAAVVPERRRSAWGRHALMHLMSAGMIVLVVHAALGGFEIPGFVQAFYWQKATAAALFLFVAKVLVVYFGVQAISLGRLDAYSPSLLNTSMLGGAAVLAFLGSLFLAPAIQRSVPFVEHYTSGAALLVLLLSGMLRGGAREAGRGCDNPLRSY